LKISAIISTYNRDQFLPGLFDSFKSQTLPATDFEVIIINNNSTDKTESLALEFIKNNGINVRYFTETNQGLSFCRNRGILEAGSELVTFIDDDALPADDFLEKTILFFDTHPDVGASGGKILLKFTGKKPVWYNDFLSPLLGYFNYGNLTRPFKNNFFRGSNMTFRRSLFDTHKPFDTRLGRKGTVLTGGEEKELFYRLKSSGIHLWYNAEAIVYHLVPPERTTVDYIKSQAYGTGKSKKVHAQIEGKYGLIKAYITEIFKWAASFAISLFCFVIFRFRKGIMILKFRYWVSKGLFSRTVQDL